MYSEGRKKAQVGKVKVDIHGKSYRIRFTYPQGTRHSFSIARATPEGWTTAIKAAQLINRDIDLGDFDSTYARYSPKHALKLEVSKVQKPRGKNLLELWNEYKIRNKDRIAASTQKKKWTVFDKQLEKTPQNLLSTNKASEFIDYLLDTYARGTLDALLAGTLYPAINEALERKEIDSNNYPSIKFKSKSKSNIECFEPKEIKTIINAFYSDSFCHPNSRFKHSFYAPMVEFLALTGCRPSEAHALTWDDIKQKNGKTFIRFNKAYTHGISMPHTKTREVRLFPCNEQLQKLLKNMPKIDNPNNLIFPSTSKGFIRQTNFRNRTWKTVINELVKQNEIEKYLKPYALRHSFITRMVREGVDVATIAALVGNSAKIILENYLASKKDFDLPEL